MVMQVQDERPVRIWTQLTYNLINFFVYSFYFLFSRKCDDNF